MPTFHSNGIAIAYETHGTGKPILLIHGFASNHIVNWVNTSWVRTLTGAGRRVIAWVKRIEASVIAVSGGLGISRRSGRP